MSSSAREIADAVRSAKISARQVLDGYLANIEAAEPEIHAFNLVTAEEGRAQADAVDAAIAKGEDVGPLAGVPIAIKDNLATRSIETTCSSKILQGWKPPYDATVVGKLRKAGAVMIGKTNLDEFAMGGSGENSAFGVTRNPRNKDKVAGGSSSGSAAAVAADFAPLGLGTDTGGSIRQPAGYTGTVGAKPTYGRVSRYGLVAFASSLDQVGPFANNVADAALLLDVISGHDRLDSTSISHPLESCAASLGEGVEGLRVGVISELMGEGISPDVQSCVNNALAALERNGAKVGEAAVPHARYGLSVYYLIATAEASSNLARYDGVKYGMRVEGQDVLATYKATRAAGFGPEVKRRIMLGTYALSAGYYDAYYGKAQKVRKLITDDFNKAYQQYDVLICPTSPTVAFDIGAIHDPLSMYFNDLCTIPTNLAGHPGISVPFGTGEAGLPVGVQVLAPALGEATMFRAAAVLETEASK